MTPQPGLKSPPDARTGIRRAIAEVRAQVQYRPSARQEERRRNKAQAVACSEYWIIAKLNGHEIPTGRPPPGHLKRDYAIHTKTTCRCGNCHGRRQWPGNNYVSSSGVSYDCIVEGQSVDEDLDEDLEELLAPLRGSSASVVDERELKSALRRRCM